MTTNILILLVGFMVWRGYGFHIKFRNPKQEVAYQVPSHYEIYRLDNHYKNPREGDFVRAWNYWPCRVEWNPESESWLIRSVKKGSNGYRPAWLLYDKVRHCCFLTKRHEDLKFLPYKLKRSEYTAVNNHDATGPQRIPSKNQNSGG